MGNLHQRRVGAQRPCSRGHGEVWDPTRPFTGDSTLKLLTSRDDEGMSTLWHSSAHLMAEALESLYPGIKFWVGPPVENGFYYDVDFGDTISPMPTFLRWSRR